MSNVIKTNISYVYSKIPANWIGILHRIYNLMAEYGIEAIKDCKANCSQRNSHIIECYTIFQSALAAYNVGKLKEADLLINYLSAQLDIYYHNEKYEFIDLYITVGNSTAVINDDYKVSNLLTIDGEYTITPTNDYFYIYIPKSLESKFTSIKVNNQTCTIRKDSEHDIDGIRYTGYRFVGSGWANNEITIKIN